jgi:hypothetical protein
MFRRLVPLTSQRLLSSAAGVFSAFRSVGTTATGGVGPGDSDDSFMYSDDDFHFLDELFEGGGDMMDFLPVDEAESLRSEKR